jgi:hypothetical protein
MCVCETSGKKILVTKQFRKPEAPEESDAPEDREPCDQDHREEQVFQNVWPQAACRLKDQGLLSMWIQLHGLIANGTFPLENIAFFSF